MNPLLPARNDDEGLISFLGPQANEPSKRPAKLQGCWRCDAGPLLLARKRAASIRLHRKSGTTARIAVVGKQCVGTLW